jgi:hypothetical protein
MSRAQLYFTFFILFPVIHFLTYPLAVGDLSMWVAMGRDMLASGNLLQNDTYTVVQTLPMVYSAGLCVVYGWLYNIGGLNLVSFLHVLIPPVWFLLWCRFLQIKFIPRDGDPWNGKTALTFLTAFAGTSLIFIPRPALVATIPLLYSYILIKQNENSLFTKKITAKLIATEILWANIHGSFLILPAMLVWQSFFLVLEKRYDLLKNRIWVTVAVTLGSLINPFGWKSFPYILETARISKERGIDEWFPPYLFTAFIPSLFFFLFSAGLAFLLIRRGSLHLKDPFFLLWASGFLALRNVFMPYLIFPVFFLTVSRPEKILSSPEKRTLNLAVALVLTAVLVALTPFLKTQFSHYLPPATKDVYDKEARSEKIDVFLQNNSGNVFNSWIYGSDLALSQKNKYYIDTRNIIFPKKIFDDYLLFLNQPQTAFPVISSYNFRFFLIHEDHQILLNWLRSRPDFELVVSDPPAFLFEKK